MIRNPLLRPVAQGPDTQGKLCRGLSLSGGDDLWSWFDGSVADVREAEDWTRFEGVEGISDAMVRSRRRAG